jgi:hypothetical protein
MQNLFERLFFCFYLYKTNTQTPSGTFLFLKQIVNLVYFFKCLILYLFDRSFSLL